MTTRLSAVFRMTEADSSASRLAACDASLSLIAADVEELTEQLDRVRAGASPLVQWLSERDAVLAEKELELARLHDEQQLALRRADDATAALHETRDLLQDHDGRATAASRELDDLRNAVAERDRELEDAERARARLDETLANREAQLVQERAAVAVLRSRVIIADDPLATDEVAGEEARGAIAGHVEYAPFPEGYRLIASDEPSPRPGDVVDVEGHSFLVTRVGRSPLPADARPCAFLVRPASAL